MPREDPFKPLLVSELIKQLKLVPQDAIVHTEGCDCVGPADKVDMTESEWLLEVYDQSSEGMTKIHKYKNAIIIRRKDGY